MAGKIGCEQVDIASEILPGSGGARNVCLAAKPPLHPDFARNVRHLIGEGGKRVGHVVDGVRQRGNLAFRLDGEPLIEVSIGDRCDHLHDAADLLSQIRGHEVDVVGQVLPRPCDTRHLRLAA